MRRRWIAIAVAILALGGFSGAVAQTVGGEPRPGGPFYFPTEAELPSDFANTAKDDLDPQSQSNEVVSVDTVPATHPDTGDKLVGVIKRRVGGGITLRRLDNQVEIKYLYIDRTCVGGTRIEIGISTDDDRIAEGNAFGYLGDKAFGGDCPEGEWTFEDMTNDVPKWDISQLGGGQSVTWDQMETFFANEGPYRVVTVALADDSASFASGARGCAYYDVFGAGARHMTDHDETEGESGGAPNGC